MQSNLFFVGLMGAGKTTVGRLLAKALNKTFYDTDHEIEHRTGVRIPVIFELEGEAGFRKREAQMIEELSQQQNIVLATGGGAVLLKENREFLKNNGTVIYLRANVQELWLRTRYDRNRPLLQKGDARKKLETLFAARDPFYTEVAHHIVDTGGQPVAQIVHKIETLLNPKLDTESEPDTTPTE